MLNTEVDLLKGNILKSLIIFAFPLFVSNLFQQLYNTVDVMIVGNKLGDASLAAMGACTAIYELLVGFALGVGNGMSIVTARSYGADDKDMVKKSVAASLVIGVFLTVILMIIALSKIINVFLPSFSYCYFNDSICFISSPIIKGVRYS